MIRLRALAGILVISFSAIFVRLADVPPTTAAFFRTLYALPFLAALLWLEKGDVRRSRQARLLAALAGLFFALDLWCWHRAIEKIGAGLSTVLGNTQVVFVGLLAWLVHREKPSRSAMVAMPVILGGVALISGLGRQDSYGDDPVAGVWLGLATAVTYAAFLLLFRQASRDARSAVGPLFDATLAATVGALVLGHFDGTLDFAVTWPAHGWLLAMALGSQVVGWLLIGSALPRLPAVETSILLPLQPAFTMVWAWLLFSERLSVPQSVGMALVLGGVGWMSFRRPSPAESGRA